MRRVYDARDMTEGVPAMIALCAPDVVLRPAREWPGIGRRVYRGHGGLRAFFGALADAFEPVRFELEDLRDYGDTLVCEVRFQTEGRTSGIAADERMAHLLRFRNGLVVEVVGYLDRSLAHAAAREGQQLTG